MQLWKESRDLFVKAVRSAEAMTNDLSSLATQGIFTSRLVVFGSYHRKSVPDASVFEGSNESYGILTSNLPIFALSLTAIFTGGSWASPGNGWLSC